VVSGVASGGHSPTTPLDEVLDDARAAGFVGPGPIEAQVHHAEGFATVARRLFAGTDSPRLLDLGSGGGLPGLVVALRWPEAGLVLLDAGQRRTAFLRVAVARLGLGDRVSVRHQRAEDCGRDPAYRAAFDGVLARSFGPPAVVAECAAPFLRPGGWLVVSEPPEGLADGASRWPTGPLAKLGMMPGERVHEGADYRILRQAEPCPPAFPRRNGVPAKKPLF
jgi:16S rRNA (guanine527-N7)-methyltransferase